MLGCHNQWNNCLIQQWKKIPFDKTLSCNLSDDLLVLDYSFHDWQTFVHYGSIMVISWASPGMTVPIQDPSHSYFEVLDQAAWDLRPILSEENMQQNVIINIKFFLCKRQNGMNISHWILKCATPHLDSSEVQNWCLTKNNKQSKIPPIISLTSWMIVYPLCIIMPYVVNLNTSFGKTQFSFMYYLLIFVIS